MADGVICGEMRHLYRDCPISFANRVKAAKMVGQLEEKMATGLDKIEGEGRERDREGVRKGVEPRVLLGNLRNHPGAGIGLEREDGEILSGESTPVPEAMPSIPGLEEMQNEVEDGNGGEEEEEAIIINVPQDIFRTGQSSVLLSVGVQVGEAEERSGEEEAGEWRENPSGPIPVFGEQVCGVASEICQNPPPPHTHTHTQIRLVQFWMGSYLRTLGILKVDLRTPVSFTLPKEYDFTRKFLKKYNLEKEGERVLTNAKLLVVCVQDQEEVSPILRLTKGEAQQVWKSAVHPALKNRDKESAWMAVHDILPVMAVMHSRGIAATATCPRVGCGEPETVRHVFWECRVARDLWAMIGPLQCPSLQQGRVLPRVYRLAVNGVGQGVEKLPAKEFEALWLTLISVKAALWTSRDLLVGKHVTVPLHATLRLLTFTLQGAPDIAIRRRGPEPHAGGPCHHRPWPP
ncbi:hypothetical protein P4O66_008806 [Electrophorus voltai]|uniref:Reverse transcriptase zinc-binding domain-containing protein n=1 Tax=Electrophorus voltai TaxID=2609070 RepID=A0AAD8ZE98_9TELE|nr:hypothetical protein P4O66_008806 [Electrophorus voltai]